MGVFTGCWALVTLTVFPVAAPRHVNYAVAGYAAFLRLASPEPRDVDGGGGGPVVFLVTALL